MKTNEIIEAIKHLAKANGSYYRFYNRLIEIKNEDIFTYEEIMKKFEEQNFKNVVDLVMFLES